MISRSRLHTTYQSFLHQDHWCLIEYGSVRESVCLVCFVCGCFVSVASKVREDLEQQLVRNHRHRRLIDHRSNHRHRQDRALHPWWCISMTIWSPNDLGVGKPSIGSNHMHSIACREGDESSMLVERDCEWLLETTMEG